MLKFLFAILLLANGALFAYHQGHLAPWFAENREPSRQARQLNADKIQLLPRAPSLKEEPAPTPAVEPAVVENDAAPAPDQAVVAVAQAVNGSKPELIACTEVGNFSESDAQGFETRLASLALGPRLSRRAITEGGSHIVFMPPQGSKEGADKKVGELRRLGVTDFFVIQDNAEMRWAISLGVFRTEEAAKKRLAQLGQQGVRTARIGNHNAATRIAFQLRELDAAAKEQLEKIKADYPAQEIRACV